MRFRKIIIMLQWWFIAAFFCMSVLESGAYTLEDTLNFCRVANTRLLPVDAPLAE